MSTTLAELLEQIRTDAAMLNPAPQAWHSYWYHRPNEAFPPPSVRQPQQYDGGARLNLVCTQTDLPAKEQRQLVQSWCELLPTRDNLRVLWFNSKVSQDMFEAACSNPHLQGLYIKWSDIRSLTPIAKLQQLTHLHIGGAPSAQPLEALHALPKLIDLELSNVNAAGNLDFLCGLPQLQSLAVSGDHNSIKRLKIESLAPLASLCELRRLELSCVALLDESLAPIGELPRLQHLLLSNQFEMEELARLSAKLPEVACDRFLPIGEPVNWTHCKKCQQARVVPLTGKRKPWLCLDCDAARIEKHIRAFQTCRAQASV